MNDKSESENSEPIEPDSTDSAQEETPASLEVESIPDNTMSYRQSHWAWMLPSTVWIGLLLVVVFFDFLTMGLIPILLIVGIAGPRYLRWRQTVYYLSEDSLYLTMVGLPIIQKRKTYRLSFDTMLDLEEKPGMLGRTLGYAEIGIVFDDRRQAKLSYLSDAKTFADHIRANTNLPGLPDTPDDETDG